MASISGSVTIAGDPDDWIACAFDADTHAFAGVADVSGGTYEITGLTAGKAYVVACRPKTGSAWHGGSDYIDGSFSVPSDTIASPYIFKATAPESDNHFSSVALLLHCDGSNNSTTFTDASGNTKTVTANGNAIISTATSAYGGASAYFDGSGDFLAIPDSNDFDLGENDFTLECWIRFSAIALNSSIISQRQSSTTGYGFYFLHSTSAGYEGLNLIYTTNGTTPVALTSAWTPSIGSWYHIAACRNGSDFRFFVDGAQVGITHNISANSIYNSTAALKIAAAGTTSTNFFNGYIDDVRITNGIARYTSDFTVPASAFPNYVGTGVSEPTWPTVAGETVADGEITWTNMGQLVQPLMQGPLIAA